ncbi:uncharacterized protein PV09_08264 [Verruconis gallopava]|uniref:Metallo-beta-lactamase domain-containing protein n=1 Tax=Verruconis gallopava TaxID=253628 RepID=A0A0D2AM50_9PEZI|nr:uncharacterized protein PV09_08264 [Verruconis gallopava]KIW00224.1 hypothetical protein PV09_08264 [Verruconis gallopava]
MAAVDNLPASNSTVIVQALDTTLCLFVKSLNFLDPVIPGHEAYNCPTMAFLVSNQSNGRRILFDAGGRKDYWNYSPLVDRRFKNGVNVLGFRCEKGVDEVLEEGGISLGSLEAVVWSHWHFDHIGDMSKFPRTTRIVVGQGFKSVMLPGYPTNPESPLLESDYANKELLEIDFDDSFKIGDFRAFDYFGDGSFYLLDVPGHAIGHMCGLARTTEDTFLLMGADTCHFAGALRPTAAVPLPPSLDPGAWGLDASFPAPCPCSIFTDCHPCSDVEERTKRPWYTASKASGSAYVDPRVADQSIASMQAFDANPNVLVCLAHDPGLFEILPLLNKDPSSTVNNWRQQNYKEQARWRFLNELPRNGKPGRPPLVLGWWKDGRQVEKDDAFSARSVT